MDIIYFPGVLERVSDGFSIFFHDLPGCVSAGDSPEHAVANAEIALALQLAGMLDDGAPIPPATALGRLPHDPAIEEYARVLVRAEIAKGRTDGPNDL